MDKIYLISYEKNDWNVKENYYFIDKENPLENGYMVYPQVDGYPSYKKGFERSFFLIHDTFNEAEKSCSKLRKKYNQKIVYKDFKNTVIVKHHFDDICNRLNVNKKILAETTGISIATLYREIYDFTVICKLLVTIYNLTGENISLSETIDIKHKNSIIEIDNTVDPIISEEFTFTLNQFCKNNDIPLQALAKISDMKYSTLTMMCSNARDLRTFAYFYKLLNHTLDIEIKLADMISFK
ncbi:MAG: hypothetical protein BGO41_01280 [Clostridiales bacterium 38-18]|nr:MAG: hypothetical protein BGO41_01280 [Clostridiales bacterium 38-18]